MSLKVDYLSLQDASELCNYSQEYLSLRARQGKIKAIKIGRNWVTTKKWVEDYIDQVEKIKNRNNIYKEISPPENLPIELTMEELRMNNRRIPMSLSAILQFGVLTVGILVVVFVGATFDKYERYELGYKFVKNVQDLSRSFDDMSFMMAKISVARIDHFAKTFNVRSKELVFIFDTFVQNFTEDVDITINDAQRGFSLTSFFFKDVGIEFFYVLSSPAIVGKFFQSYWQFLSKNIQFK